MKRKPLTANEVVGLILLAVIIVGITVASVLLNTCSGNVANDQEPVIVTIEETGSGDANGEAGIGVGNESGEKETGRSRKKKGRKAASTRGGNGKRAATNGFDPFNDTVPRYYD
ncbi:MAG: hypothetical protein J1E97_02150 [Muribaculaceae bacterium]|nr:hypothetical protein [Muribaculaceae bacterium]